MLRIAIAALLGVPALVLAAGTAPEGRWEGVIRVPDRELRFVADFARDRGGAWTGSITIPGLSVQGASLSPIEVSDAADCIHHRQRARHLDARPGVVQRAARLDGAHRRRAAAGGQRSRVRDAEDRIGAGRAAAAQHARERAGRGRVGRRVRARRLSAPSDDHSCRTATTRARQHEFVIVGKQTTRLPVDFVGEDGHFVRVEAQAMGVTFEGRFDAQRDEIGGAITLGAVELPLTLRRAARKPS